MYDNNYVYEMQNTFGIKCRETSPFAILVEKYIMDILDLNEEIFHHIFGYLKMVDVYTKVRGVCSQFKGYVDEYIHVEGSFWLVGYNDVRDEDTNQPLKAPGTIIINLYKSRKKEIAVCWGTLTPIPLHRYYKTNNNSIWFCARHEYFGGKHNGKLRVGCCCVTYGRKYHSYYLYEFDNKRKEWQVIATTDYKRPRYLISTLSLDEYGIAFFVDSARIIIHGNTVVPTSKYIASLTHHIQSEFTNEFINIINIEYHGRAFIPEHSRIFPLQQNKFILIELSRITHQSFNIGYTVFKLWEGVLSWKDSILCWTELKLNNDLVDVMGQRCNPICFKMQNKLYFTGGRDIDCWGKKGSKDEGYWLSCYYYDLKEEKFYITNHTLPFLMIGSNNLQIDNKIATNVQETMTVIVSYYDIRNYSNIVKLLVPQIVIFTETDGFQDVTNLSKLPFVLGELVTIKMK
jgi:hypothetical protein